MGFAQQCRLVGSVQICVFGDGVQGKGIPFPCISNGEAREQSDFSFLTGTEKVAPTVRMVADEVFCWLPTMEPSEASCGYEFNRQTRDVLNQNLEPRDALCFPNECSDEVWNKAVKRAQL